MSDRTATDTTSTSTITTDQNADVSADRSGSELPMSMGNLLPINRRCPRDRSPHMPISISHSANTQHDETAGQITHLLDAPIELAHSLPARVDVIRTAELVDLVTEIRAETNGCASVARAEGRETVALASNGREVCAELLKVELLLVTQLDGCPVSPGVLEERVGLLQERLD